MVMPRKTSSETIRPARATSVAAGMVETGAAMVSALAMGIPSMGGDTTAGRKMSQRRSSFCRRYFVGGKQKRDGEDVRHAFVRGKKLLRSLFVRLVHAEVVGATQQRSGEAGTLRDPPHAADPVMSAIHHLFPDVVHDRGANLNCRI